MYRATLQSNVHSSQGRGVKGKRHAHTGRRDDRGFTLVELLIVITIVPLIIGALAGGLLEVFSLQNGTANRISDSADAQVIAATFTKDVQSATTISTNPSPSQQCGTGTSLLELAFGEQPGSTNTEIVDYSLQLQSGTTYSLVRNDCPTWPTGQVSSTVLTYDALQPCVVGSSATCQPAPIAYDGTTVDNTSPVEGVTTIGISSLQFPITEPNSTYTYQLSATPAEGPFPAKRTWDCPHRVRRAGSRYPVPGSSPRRCASSDLTLRNSKRRTRAPIASVRKRIPVNQESTRRYLFPGATR